MHTRAPTGQIRQRIETNHRSDPVTLLALQHVLATDQFGFARSIGLAGMILQNI